MCGAELALHTESLDEGEHVRIPFSAHTLEGFRAWAWSDEFPERGQYSYINGVLHVDTTREEIESHNKAKTEIVSALANDNMRQEKEELYSRGVLITNTEAEVSNEPDPAFVSWQSFESGRAHVIAREGHAGQFMEIEGTPDWLMEIVNRSSVHKDTQLLRDCYHRAKVPEYWLVDARGAEIDFRILAWQPEGYVAAEVRDGWQRSVVFGAWYRLTRERSRVGRWTYSLLREAK